MRPPETVTCVFCEIAHGRGAAHIVDEDDLSLALLDIQPFTEGHCLIISNGTCRGGMS